MMQSVKRRWGVLGWRVLFVCALFLLQEWAFAALIRPNNMGGLASKSSNLSLAISFTMRAKQSHQVESSNKAVMSPSTSESSFSEPSSVAVETLSASPEAVALTTAALATNKKTAVMERESSRAKQKSIKHLPKSTSLEQNKNNVQQASVDVAKSKVAARSQQQVLTNVETMASEMVLSEADTTEPNDQIIRKPVFAAQPKPPRYPTVARKRGQEGTVWLDIWLDDKGNKSKIEITKSSGLTILDKSALKAVSEWKFKPYEKNGLAIASRVRVPVVFSLN